MRSSAEKKLRIIQAIVAARKKAGLTQMEVSARMGMAPNFMAKVESAKRNIKAWELYDIGDALGVDPRDLLGQPRRKHRVKE